MVRRQDPSLNRVQSTCSADGSGRDHATPRPERPFRRQWADVASQRTLGEPDVFHMRRPHDCWPWPRIARGEAIAHSGRNWRCGSWAMQAGKGNATDPSALGVLLTTWETATKWEARQPGESGRSRQAGERGDFWISAIFLPCEGLTHKRRLEPLCPRVHGRPGNLSHYLAWQAVWCQHRKLPAACRPGPQQLLPAPPQFARCRPRYRYRTERSRLLPNLPLPLRH